MIGLTSGSADATPTPAVNDNIRPLNAKESFDSFTIFVHLSTNTSRWAATTSFQQGVPSLVDGSKFRHHSGRFSTVDCGRRSCARCQCAHEARFVARWLGRVLPSRLSPTLPAWCDLLR